MRNIGVVLALYLLGGCGTYHTLEELEQEAMRTGDWSRVEQREQMLASRAARMRPSCPSGYISYCENHGVQDRCACISSEVAQRMLMSWR